MKHKCVIFSRYHQDLTGRITQRHAQLLFGDAFYNLLMVSLGLVCYHSHGNASDNKQTYANHPSLELEPVIFPISNHLNKIEKYR